MDCSVSVVLIREWSYSIWDTMYIQFKNVNSHGVAPRTTMTTTCQAMENSTIA